MDDNDYYKQSSDWTYDAYESVLVSRDRWFLATLISITAVLLSGLGIYKFLPLKTVQTVVVVNNQTTGDIRTIDALDTATILATIKRANVEKHISDYIRYRESYDSHTISTWYKYVQIMSSSTVTSNYKRFIQSNPKSPIKTLKADGSIEVVIDTINPLNDTSVLVDFKTTSRSTAGGLGRVYYFRAVVDYIWTGKSNDGEFKSFNPLGFTVTKYRKDQKNISAIKGGS